MTKSKQASMFLTSVTVIDHAYIDATGCVMGGSFNPKFIVSGDIDPIEKVVIDFSTVKKRIKALIDGKESGYDHKLLVFPGWSGAEGGGYSLTLLPGDMVRLTTDAVELLVPASAIRTINVNPKMGYPDAIKQDMEAYLVDGLRDHFPTVEVQVILCEEATALDPLIEPQECFTYTHGLKDSTSWGCQNIAHGHYSYLQLLDSEMRAVGASSVPDMVLWPRIAQDLDGAVFIKRENVVDESDESISICYESLDRGVWQARYNKAFQKVIVLDTETTVEFLVDYVRTRYLSELKMGEAVWLAVSEGLTKGALVKI